MLKYHWAKPTPFKFNLHFRQTFLVGPLTISPCTLLIHILQIQMWGYSSHFSIADYVKVGLNLYGQFDSKDWFSLFKWFNQILYNNVLNFSVIQGIHLKKQLNVYRQPYKIMAYLTFHKWLVSVCNIHNNIWMVQTKTSHLENLSYTFIFIRLTKLYARRINHLYLPLLHCIFV